MNKQLIAIVALAAIACIAVLGLVYTKITGFAPGNGPPTDFPGQGQGVPFANGGTGEPEEGCTEPNPQADKCDALEANCETICKQQGADYFVVTRNYAVSNEGPVDPPGTAPDTCPDTSKKVYVESCTVYEGSDEDPEVCADVICACFYCPEPAGPDPTGG